MKKSLIALAVASVCAAAAPKRARTHDVAFTYRMGAGFAGDVNRTHPASIVPAVQNATNPIRKYGDPALIDTTTNTYRGFIATDASDSVATMLRGVLVRDYPVQAASSAGSFGQQALTDGTTAPGANNVLNVLQSGFMLVKVRGTGTITLGGDVYVFCTADETGHVQGGFEVAAVTGKTVKITNAKFRGPADANGIAEIQVWNQN